MPSRHSSPPEAAAGGRRRRGLLARLFKASSDAVPAVTGGVPQHVAIIMDGNGRWAKERGLPRQAGHRAGATRLHDITAAAARQGVRYLTVYAFSTENWSRPEGEVRALMKLFVEFFHLYDERLREADVRLRFMGDRRGLPEDVQVTWAEAEAGSLGRQGLQLIIAFNYGGRQELVSAARHLAREAAAGRLDPETISESDIGRNLYLPDVPDPDLVIRTSGEKRLSNFLVWEAAYAEFYATPVYWPDFDADALLEAIQAYQQRDRRFGALASNEMPPAAAAPSTSPAAGR
ncbi:MAG: isoprenyl transferase [Bacillota bacterium]|nr:isoprenyl transferase [Bacillota bacterium]